ncbi:prepilin peptidase [Candidatus Pelagibacter sp.]|nr:prepilin peptidase [Candidatus Pelagibacter sp.]
MFYIIVFIFGSIWGSFSNVCIRRIPNNTSVIKGRSHCPSCNKLIKWYDNIPLLSFLILKAKCRDCSTTIDVKYFIIELISALNFVLIFYLFGFSSTTILFFILSIGFLIIFFIDLKHFIIPNEITYPLMMLGFLKSFDPNLNLNLFPNFIDSLIGGFFGYVIIWLVIFIYKKFRNKEGMGLGDAKLVSVIGFWFGWISIPFVIFFSSAIALIKVIPDLIKNKKNLSSEIPFGPYLIVGCLTFLILNSQIKLLVN